MDYSSLKTNIAAWLHRDDLTAYLDTFIDLFEARANRNIRVPEMETVNTYTPTTEYLDFPTGFLELRNIQVNDTSESTIAYIPPHRFSDMGLDPGTPRYYTVENNQFKFSPSAAGKTIELSYFSTIAALSDSNTTNFLITSDPDYYLFGSILEALKYAIDDRAIQVEQMVNEIESRINRRGRMKRHGSVPMAVRAS